MMILTCSQCETSYQIQASAVGPSGRRVKCIQCGHTWLVQPVKQDKLSKPEAVTASIKAEPLSDGAGLPAIPTSPISMVYKIFPAGLFLVLCLVVWGLIIHPDVIRIIGSSTTNGVILEDVKVTHDDEGVVLSGKVSNKNNQIAHIGKLRIHFLDVEGHTLASKAFDASGTIINPGESFAFSNQLEKVPQDTANIVLDMGNDIELFLR